MFKMTKINVLKKQLENQKKKVAEREETLRQCLAKSQEDTQTIVDLRGMNDELLKTTALLRKECEKSEEFKSLILTVIQTIAQGKVTDAELLAFLTNIALNNPELFINCTKLTLSGAFARILQEEKNNNSESSMRAEQPESPLVLNMRDLILSLPTSVYYEIVKHLSNDEWVEAIKLFRSVTKESLLNSKNAVEYIQRENNL